MNTTEFVTPSGHTMLIKSTFTYGDRRRIERLFTKSAKLDPKNPEKFDLDAEALYDAQDLAVSLLVTEVRLKDGTVHTGPDNPAVVQAILDMPEEDGKAVYDEINRLTAPAVPPEKKGA